MTRHPYFHPHPLMRHMAQATPARRRGNSVLHSRWRGHPVDGHCGDRQMTGSSGRCAFRRSIGRRGSFGTPTLNKRKNRPWEPK